MTKDILVEIDNSPSPTTPEVLPVEGIIKVHVDNLSFEEFFSNFMQKNLPIIITGVSDGWESHKNWILDNALNTHYLKSKLKTRLIPIANCSKQEYNAHERTDMDLYKFFDYWDDTTAVGELLYLKDWHLKKEEPEYEFYDVPKYFSSDWLNEYLLDNGLDDYQFCYFGRKGTWTPFHADVFSSFSWSTNILGCKKWLLLPPHEEEKLLDSLKNLPFSITKEDLISKSVRFYEITQNAGEAIFVPSQWHHQVTNEEHTVSINHNWFNGCNIEVIYQTLANSYDQVLREIDDCKDMEGFFEHSQVMLKSFFGMNFVDFYEILKHIADKRIRHLVSGENFKVFRNFQFGSNLITYDLQKIEQVLQLLADKGDLLRQLQMENETLELINSIQSLINR